ncbi:hypothetical protein DAQ1742_04378 [Dickeya aquatica]|uniref:Uncharacterized protein n=1 Tax=Dickeya aquatica TaxID=1401087 RepID=A0A375AGE2_9GAMM|nr:hypothetical protein DAQ1742_04378 [Dickeya aquatica]
MLKIVNDFCAFCDLSDKVSAKNTRFYRLVRKVTVSPSWGL